MRPVESAPVALLLAPLAVLYGALVERRNRRFDRPGEARRAPVPVVSVGNLSAGGTGKTPLVSRIARMLLSDGRRPAIVTRGYGGRAGKGPLVLSTGSGPRVPWEESGDEPHLLARTIRGLIVVVGSDRLTGAVEAARHGADIVVLDDGFQHRRLARDLDLVLLDARAPLGNGRLLPAGSLREPPASLSRASAIVLTRASSTSLDNVREVARRFAPGVPVFASFHRPAGFVDALGVETAAPPAAVAFCGIGNPVSFLEDLENDGIRVRAARVFPDHHPYSEREIRGLARLAARHRAPLVTTEKDLVRIPALARDALVLARRVDVTLEDEGAFSTLLRTAVPGALP